MPDPLFANVRWLFFDWGGVLKDEIAGFKNVAKSVAILAENAGSNIAAAEFYDAFLEEEYAGSPDKIVTALTKFSLSDPIRAAIVAGLEADDSPAPWYPGVFDVLNAFSGKYQLGLISNNSAGFDERLEAAGVKHYFDVRVGSTDVGVSKPDPAIFNLAMERANCTAAETIMIGDRPDKDIAGANSVGMRTIRIRQGIYADQDPATSDEHADADITDIRQLPDLLL